MLEQKKYLTQQDQITGCMSGIGRMQRCCSCSVGSRAVIVPLHVKRKTWKFDSVPNDAILAFGFQLDICILPMD